MIEYTTPWPRVCRRSSGPLVSREPRRRKVREASLSNARRSRKDCLLMKNGSLCVCAILFLAMAMSADANSAAAQEKPLTAREVIGRIQAHVGIPWQKETVDTFKAGNSQKNILATPVTIMATLDVHPRD